MFAKRGIVRLHGKALLELVAAVFERDKHSCVVCGRWVEDGVKPHHEPPAAGRKSDELGKMVLLCNCCHYERHHGARSGVIKASVERYLRNENNN